MTNLCAPELTAAVAASPKYMDLYDQASPNSIMEGKGSN